MGEKKGRFGIGVGSLSILMVFVILCLTSFAALSLVSANADRRLSQKTADAVAEYYILDRSGEETLAYLAGIFQEERDLALDEEDYWRRIETRITPWQEPDLPAHEVRLTFSQTGEREISYRVLQGESVRSLEVVLDVSSCYALGGSGIRRVAWQIVVTESQDENAMPNLWSGAAPNA